MRTPASFPPRPRRRFQASRNLAPDTTGEVHVTPPLSRSGQELTVISSNFISDAIVLLNSKDSWQQKNPKAAQTRGERAQV